MKFISLLLLLFLSILIACNQDSANRIPVIKAKSKQADYRIGNDLIKGSWTISPHIEADSFIITCRNESEEFAFYTDQDSISFQLVPGQIQDFYVLLNDTAKALTVVKAIKPANILLKFDNTVNAKLNFWYEQNSKNEYLNRLRAKYPIDSLIKDSKTDTDRAMKILNWVHNQWAHNGNNVPNKPDAISILEEVKEGKNFRCVEYGIVSTACLNAVGLKSRTLALKTKDVERRPSGAGHVLLEVFLNDLQKWVMLDGQWDVMPVLNGIPLNAVEFQRAITERYQQLEIRSLSNISKRRYCEWIYPYLYYFDVAFDNRETTSPKAALHDGKRKLMLVPIGANNPTVFQVKGKITDCLYTNSYSDFYRPPQ